jgi:recombination protein RecR
MKYYPETVENLINKLKNLPGIGPKSAERIVNYLLEDSESNVLALSENLQALKKEVKLCQKCFNLSDTDICHICRDEKRENVICVVEEVKDLVIMEKTGFNGRYHVLGGRISTLDRVEPSDLKIAQFIERLKNEKVNEVIIATNPTPEGEDTAVYISGILKKMGIKHSRLAYGLPVGAEIEYVDVQTLRKSIEGRKQM